MTPTHLNKKRLYAEKFVLSLSLLFLFLSILWIAGCGPQKNDSTANETAKAADTVTVKTTPVTQTTFTEYGIYYGRVTGIEDAQLICYAGGRVEKVLASEGDRVKKGQSLARIDAAKAYSLYNTAKKNEKIALDNLERTRQYLKDGNASQVSVDQMEIAWLSAQANRIDAEKMWRGAYCISPINGIVLSRSIDKFDELAPGMPTFTVGRINKLTIRIGIPETDIPGVKTGSSADITFALFPQRSWEGTISRLSREIDPHNRVLSAELTIDNTDRILKPGMTAQVKLRRMVHDSVFVVPTGAILTGKQGSYVALADGNRARLQTVTTGASDETRTIIVDGITDSDVLIVQGHHLVTDNTILNIQ